MEMTIPVSDGTIGGYLAEPAGAGPHPGVVLIHDAFGLSQDTKNITDRFAAEGYLALSPDLYARGGMRRCVRRVFSDMFANQGRTFDDIEASRALLAGREDCSGRIGIAGFCMGGGFALMTAARGFDAGAVNYAHLPKDVDAVLAGACPVVASYGAKDRTLRGTAAELDAALARAGAERDVHEYADAGHSFLNRHDLGPAGALLRVAGIGYHGPSAEHAWGRILRFFEAHLRA